jgi:hypothetical protein
VSQKSISFENTIGGTIEVVPNLAEQLITKLIKEKKKKFIQ